MSSLSPVMVTAPKVINSRVEHKTPNKQTKNWGHSKKQPSHYMDLKRTEWR